MNRYSLPPLSKRERGRWAALFGPVTDEGM